jgi:putative transposase
MGTGCRGFVRILVFCPFFIFPMARLPRLVLPHLPHHILQSSNDGQLVFREPEDFQRFLAWLRESAKEFKVAVHA